MLLTVALLPFIVAVVRPVKVYPVFAVSVIDAVYCVPPLKGLLLGLQVTFPLVKLPLPVEAVLGATPATGAVTVIAALVIGVEGAGLTVKLRPRVCDVAPPPLTVTTPLYVPAARPVLGLT